MAIQKRGQQDKAWIADNISDLNNIPFSSMGSTCWVIETAEKYMLNSEGKWILQTLSTNGKGGIVDGDPNNYVTIAQMNKVIQDMKAVDEGIIEYSNTQDQIILNKINEINEEATVWNQL